MEATTHQAAARTFREISVGETFRVARTFTAEDVDRFAELSGDYSPLHVDAEYAASTEFGGQLVHGMLLASLFSQLVGMRIPGKYALHMSEDLVFRRPVLVGEPVVASARVADKKPATRTVLLNTEIRDAHNRVAVSGSAKVKVLDEEPLEDAAPPAAPPRTATKIALVTGASRGIGAEIARTLGSRGIAVAVNFLRNAEAAEAVVRSIHASGGQAVAVQADVRHQDDVRQMMDAAVERFGGLDMIVNCAVGELHQRPFAELPWAAFQQQLDYQLKAVVEVCRAAYPHLKARGGGSVLNVLCQVASDTPPLHMADYVAAKYALKGLSKALAAEWAADGIRVNTVSPGLTATELTQHYPERAFKMEAARTPLRRLARPADIARAAAFLLGQEAEFLTGIDISVTGGQVMS